MEEEISQIWAIVVQLTLKPRKFYYGEYVISYLRDIVDNDYIRITPFLRQAKNYPSAEAANAVINTEYFKKWYPNGDAFAMLVSESVTRNNIHYLNEDSILHQRIRKLVDEEYSEKESAYKKYLETLKNITLAEETPN